MSKLQFNEAMNELRMVALGNASADLVVQGGNLVNVYTGEIYPADVAVKGDRIAAIGDVSRTIGDGTQTIDAKGMHLTPGFIDQHAHVHESQLNIIAFANGALPHGTTGLCTDLYGEVVVGGKEAARVVLDMARDLPFKLFFVVGFPSYYQNKPFGHNGWPTREDILEMIEWPDCYGIDDTSASRAAAGDPEVLELIDAVHARGKKVCGHGAAIGTRLANAWIAYARELDDHESIDPMEAVEKARLGIFISVREGAGCYNLDDVIKAITEHGADPRRFCLCTDVPSAITMADEGHIDYLIRRAIKAGVPPVTAIQMGTLNTAECLKVADNHGAIAPGKMADIVMVGDLNEFQVDRVIAHGQLVVEGGKMVEEFPIRRYPDAAYGTVRLSRPIVADDFRIEVSNGRDETKVRVMGVSGVQVITEELHEVVPVQDGEIKADPARDIVKIAAIDRVLGKGDIGVGLAHGFGLRSGALATTFNSQQENMILIGVSEEDMALAANKLAEVDGGFIVVDSGEIKALLELPIFGLESDQSFDHTVKYLTAVRKSAAELGVDMPAPFMTLGFVALPAEVPSLKICPYGLIDVDIENDRIEKVDIEVEE